MNNTINKSIIINSTPEKIWNILTDLELIKQRCAPFAEGNYAMIDERKKGATITWMLGDEPCTKGILRTCEPHSKLVTQFYELDDNGGFTKQLGEMIESYLIRTTDTYSVLEIEAGPFAQEDWEEWGDHMTEMRDLALDIIKGLAEK